MENNNILSKDYLIPDVNNKEEYQNYKVRIFTSVPENTVLLCKNKITGRYYTLGSGFKIVAPWVETKFVSLATKPIDYPKEVYKTSDGIEVTVDLAISVKITDAVKFERDSQAPLTELGVVAKDLMRIYIAQKEADEIYTTRVTKSNLDPENRLAEFEEKTGLKVEKIYLKNIELPRSIVDDYEKKKEAEKKRDIAKIEAEEQEIRANANAKVTRIEGEAHAAVKAKEIDYIVETLIAKGLTKNQIIDYMAKTIFAKEGTQVIANLNGNPVDSANIGAMSAVANTLIKNTEENNTIENNEIEQIQTRPRVKVRRK